MLVRRALALAALTLLLPALTWAQGLPTARPEDVGLSSARLARIAQLVTTDVERGRMPGAVVLVARRGKVAYHEAWGFRDKQAGAAMPKDAIFPIYSMTKPFTSVAVMMLVEEGRIQLTEPASKYLPQLGKLPVGVERFDAATGKATFHTVPADRDMTVMDLLRHTSGLTYGVFGKSAVKDLYLKGGADANDHTNAELIDKLGKLPLAYQPGTTWEYSRSTDVLGRLVEVVSGMPLGRFLDERIYKPLKMPDTAFWLPADKHGRIAMPLPIDPDDGKPVKLIDLTAPRTYESGGGGAASTAMDYARFSQMMLNRGQLDAARLLGKKTVEYMTSDQLGGIKYQTPGHSFGLGFSVRVADGLAGQPGSVGEYGWGGFGGTSFFVDPKEELIAVWMALGPNQRPHYRPLFKNLVMQSITD